MASAKSWLCNAEADLCEPILPWRPKAADEAAEKFSAGVVTLEPGKGHDSHNHPGCEEILYVLSGKGVQMVDPPSGRVEQEVGAGVLIHIPPDVFHSTVCTGDEPMRLLAIYAPPGPEVALRAMEGVVIEPPKR